MAEQVDVIVVGAGLAGLGAAYHMAGAGLEVLVVERGDYPGAKNVTGGRLYLNPVRPFYPELLTEGNLGRDAVERRVVKERLSMISEASVTSLEVQDRHFSDGPPHSVTLLRGKFDRWLADQAAERGALVVSGYKVDDLVWEGEQVVGISTAGDEVHAHVVVAADGALSFIAERAGLRGRLDPTRYALGIKEIIELPSETIQERFGLMGEGGLAHLVFGVITHGVTGGGFLYTNLDSISIGLVLGMSAMMAKGAQFQAHELIDEFKRRPEIQPMLAGGRVVEYSAHAIPESAYVGLSSMVRGGLIVAGDAAGLSLNIGISVRGMDFALASGALAARAILEAFERGDFSENFLRRYETLLRESFVLQDQETFRPMAKFLENPRLYDEYPGLVGDLFRRLFWIGSGSKAGLWPTVRRMLKEMPTGAVLGDLWRARRL
jgi:electron transfer flavoprotein-quinone oxidoreductase